MSKENVEIIARTLDEVQVRPDALYEILDEDIVWVPGGFSPGGTIYGLDGVRE